MPISDFPSIPGEKFISAAEAVEMVMDRFRSCGCTVAEISAWLSGLARDGKLKLWWTNRSPEQSNGKALYLAGEDRILVPGFPMAWAVDELDWNAGTLRRRLRVPMLDWARLTPEERLAFHDPKFDGPWEPRERGTAELRYPFQVERAELVAILNAVPGPLSDAAGISIRDLMHRPSPAGAPGVGAVAQITRIAAVVPGSGSAERATRSQARKADPRNKSEAMLKGLERALNSGALLEGQRATLKAAYRAMLYALGHKLPPTGMGEDAFAKHCKPWLREHGIYG